MTGAAARRLAAALGMVVATLAGACSSPTGPESERDRLRQNQARWRQAGIASYQMRQENFCFCPAAIRGPAWVRVREGEVVSLVLVATGEPVPAQYANSYRTVDQLFASIQRALDEPFDSVHVEYDPQLGHPVRIQMDWRTNVFDDEVLINVGELTPLR